MAAFYLFYRGGLNLVGENDRTMERALRAEKPVADAQGGETPR